MEIQKTYIGKSFDKSAINLIKSKFIFFIVSFFEIYDLTISLLNQENSFFYLNKVNENIKTKLIKLLLQISPYLNYDSIQKNKEKASYDPNYNVAIAYFGFLIIFYIYLFFGTQKIKYEKNVFRQVVDKILVNFFDFILFRLAPLYGFDSIFRCLFNNTSKEHLNLINIIA